MNFDYPVPISDYKRVLLAHGGGKMTRDLLEKILHPRLSNPHLLGNHVCAILNLPKGKLAFTTDSYVACHNLYAGVAFIQEKDLARAMDLLNKDRRTGGRGGYRGSAR